MAKKTTSTVIDSPPIDPLREVDNLMSGGAPLTLDTAASTVPVDLIDPWPICESVRRDVEPEAYEALRENIRVQGIQNPLWVMKSPSAPDRFVLIAGYRRIACAKEIGIKDVPVVIRNVKTEDEAHLLSLIENTAREDLSETDQLRAVRWIMETYGEKVTHKQGPKAKAGSASQRAEGRVNYHALATLTGRPLHWSRSRSRTLEMFDDGQIERIAQRITADREDPTRPARLTWSKVFDAVIDPDAENYRRTILELVDGQAPADDKSDEDDKGGAPSPLKEIYVPVRSDVLDREGVSLRIGVEAGRPLSQVYFDVKFTRKLTVGSTRFSQGDRGDKRMSEIFSILSEVFIELAGLGVTPKPNKRKVADEEIQDRAALKESMDSALEALATKSAKA